MKRALMLNVIDPGIGGVLIKGEKGTAKSTTVRSMNAVLPYRKVVKGCPFRCEFGKEERYCPYCKERIDKGEKLEPEEVRMRVIDLPLSATEDRVSGTLDLEHVLKTGEKKFEPGVLAQAHRNILYVDEINLLNDHIVDVLLDAAAMGVNTIEREGISYSHPSRFILVGTMNPEEGDLRPQLLDRFGLCVNVEGLDDPDTRLEVILRREEFEANPQKFIRKWSKEDNALAKRITKAQKILPKVTIPKDMLSMIVSICIDLGVDGHRGDINMMKTSKTLAAYAGRKEVNEDDIRQAAELVLAHRMRKNPFDNEELDRNRIQESIDRSKNEDKGSDEQSPNDTGKGGDPKGSKNFEASDPFA
jgi:Mg-chelatase subunit ChlI